ncbi:Uma2 family endonuclease [Ancylothrix sp. C2]|uniref:Uma2 family endonuclease n=1 Tax=Ancylothrix sp. D3o TaxID=2953691 RepID=UPI0021BAABAB|nr:Uma2 family endonuclease [Ancylothrix sp. D3o]MCT7948838.1 Uma2 family endonuclease [Ancylothrix sp. D3o]
MTIAQTSEQTPAAEEKLEGYIPPPTDLIFDDGEPLESNRHRIAMNLLIRSLKHAWSERNDFYTGGNMFIYYSSNQARNRNFRGPDFFVVLDTDGTRERQGWVVWEEDGRYPDVIVELMSKSTANEDTGPKKDIYERIFHTSDYFVYHPFQPQSLQGWHLNAQQQYQPLQPNEHGWLWCEKLGFWLGIWEATLERETAPWLRFFDPQGNLILLPEEAAQIEAQQAQIEAQQAQIEAQQAQIEAQQAQQRATELEALLNRYKQQFGELPE